MKVGDKISTNISEVPLQNEPQLLFIYSGKILNPEKLTERILSGTPLIECEEIRKPTRRRGGILMVLLLSLVLLAGCVPANQIQISNGGTVTPPGVTIDSGNEILDATVNSGADAMEPILALCAFDKEYDNDLSDNKYGDSVSMVGMIDENTTGEKNAFIIGTILNNKYVYTTCVFNSEEVSEIPQQTLVYVTGTLFASELVPGENGEEGIVSLIYDCEYELVERIV